MASIAASSTRAAGGLQRSTSSRCTAPLRRAPLLQQQQHCAAAPLRRVLPLLSQQQHKHNHNHPNQCRRPSVHCAAALDASVSAAVTQQAIAFAIVLAAEGAYSYANIPEGDKGRPSPTLVGAGVAGTAAAAALVNTPVGAAGLFLGFATAAAMLAVCAKRALDLEYADMDWPGPKAWPAGMGLISFFALSVFWQGIFASVFAK